MGSPTTRETTRFANAEQRYGPQVVMASLVGAVAFVLFSSLRNIDHLGIDSIAVWQGAHDLIVHGDPYFGAGSSTSPFVYPPGCALFFAPFAATSSHAFVAGMLVLNILSVAGLGLGCARVLDIRVGSWKSVFLVLIVMVLPIGLNAATLGNATILVATLGLWSIVAAAGGRWYAAALLLGLGLVIKPLLIFIGLIFLIRRALRQLALAAAIPLALNAAALLLVRHPMKFIAEIMPRLLSGGLVPPSQNASLWARGVAVHASPLVVLMAKVVVVIVVCAGLYLWRDSRDLRGFIVVCMTPTIGLFLVTRIDEANYDVFAVIFGVALIAMSEGLVRHGISIALMTLAIVPMTDVATASTAAQLVLLGSSAWLGAKRRCTPSHDGVCAHEVRPVSACCSSATGRPRPRESVIGADR